MATTLELAGANNLQIAFAREPNLQNRRRELFAMRESVGVASAQLARLLRLDPSILLFPVEKQPLPLEYGRKADAGKHP